MFEHNSLSFSRNTNIFQEHRILGSDVNIGVFSVGIQAANSFQTINTTTRYNNEFIEIMKKLTELRQQYQQEADLATSADATLRRKGVSLAWKYEQAEIKLGGSGTTNWTESQRQEILNTGTVRGAIGHHINNAADHPKDQANPDNIRFAKDHEEHMRMHHGNTQVPTEGEMIDRDARLAKAQRIRVFKNELAGLGIAAAIGLGIGFTIGFIVTIAQTGISPESIRYAAIAGGKVGAEGAAFGAVNHLITRGIGELATNAMQGILSNLGVTVTENITKICNMAVVGSIAIIAFSVYQFFKLKKMGFGTRESIFRVGKQAAFSASVLLVSIIVQGIWGGAAGMIVSVSIGIIVVVYKTLDTVQKKRLAEKIQLYVIDKVCPYTAEVA